MASTHHKNKALRTSASAEGIHATIAAFLASCRTPALVEYGEPVIKLYPERYSIEVVGGRLCIEVWNEERSLSRRILNAEPGTTGTLDCIIRKFGGKEGKLSFLDLDRPQTAVKVTRSNRSSFAEQFRRMLFRQFPGWEIQTLSAGLDLQRSLSSSFPRAHLKLGHQHMAALACPGSDQEHAFLTSALIWHAHVSSFSKGGENLTGLSLFLPERSGALTSHRLRWCRQLLLRPKLIRFNHHGSAGEVDPDDLGNVDSHVNAIRPQDPIPPAVQALLRDISELPGVCVTPAGGGGWSIRCRGVQFGTLADGVLRYGIETNEIATASSYSEVQQLAEQISGSESFLSGSQARLRSSPERWMESCIRPELQKLDATLLPSPVHGQVLTFAAGDRDLIDLLAVSGDGRLSIFELKAAEDMHLPMQALDYWMRIARHSEAGELQPLFPHTPLSLRKPRLALVAPATCFHPTNATVLSYFSPEIEVERVGLNKSWREKVEVVVRLTGAQTPLSHRPLPRRFA